MDENLSVTAEERVMLNWFKRVFRRELHSIEVGRQLNEVPSLHVVFDDVIAARARGAKIQSEIPEKILDILVHADRSAGGPIQVQLHSLHRAPISARGLGLWLATLCSRCRRLEFYVIDPDQRARDALETARRHGCVIQRV